MKATRFLSFRAARDVALAAAMCSGLVAACVQTSVNDESPAAPPTVQPAGSAGRCAYTNPFSSTEECRDYLGKGWTAESATADCAQQKAGTFTKGESCTYASELGTCLIHGGADDAYELVFPGEDKSKCASFKQGCEVFAGGKFTPGKPCEGVTTDPGGGIGTGGTVYQPPTLSCVDPLPGEPAGATNGKVCTRSMISGCTEAGRHFNDYSSCSPVLTQRPYWPAPPSDFVTPAGDPHLTDPQYLGELDWVKEQVEACGCVCCHSEKVAPKGSSNWYIEAGPIWTDTFYPTGLAMAAGWIDSTSFGAYPPEMNNGFSRDKSGIPSTDPDRMIAFFEGELARRGYKKEDFANETPFGGPLYQQSLYQPGPCAGGEGVTTDGKVVWSGGGARYVYVLASGSKNPGAPPNLDLPEGTLWRLDVSPQAEPISSGIKYGETLPNTSQGFPAQGSPAALVPGTEYYLYVDADIAIPITRCLFTYGK
jgi:hypothetical protein